MYSVLKTGTSFYTQMFVEECKYVVQEKVLIV